MTDPLNYAVFLFPQALEALGDAIKPYLRKTPGGPHIVLGSRRIRRAVRDDAGGQKARRANHWNLRSCCQPRWSSW
jgi:hypothetical protein